MYFVTSLQVARRNRSLKLLRLSRDKKSLIWQKRYLTKLLEQQYSGKDLHNIYLTSDKPCGKDKQGSGEEEKNIFDTLIPTTNTSDAINECPKIQKDDDKFNEEAGNVPKARKFR